MVLAVVKKLVWIEAALLVTLYAAQVVIAGEYHGGGQSLCSDCHIMHGSKDNVVWVVTEPLLKNPNGEVALCLSCHDGSNTSAPDIVASGTSAGPTNTVSTSYTSKYGSSAGFFQSDCTVSASPFGHDLYSPGSTTAPLSSSYTKSGPMKCSDCHDPHGSPNYRNLLSDPNPNHVGEAPIVIGSHVRQTTPVNQTTPNASVAYDTSNVGFYPANNFKAWCADCHDMLSDNSTGVLPAHYVQHPSDVSMSSGQHVALQNWTSGAAGQDTGFGADIGDSTSGIPRVRYGSSTGSSAVTSSSDTVFCLSCHKSHGSKYKSALVWPFHAVGADSLSGCQQCHSK